MSDKQTERLTWLFATDVHGDAHVEVEATWRIYQAMITVYREPDRSKGRALMATLIVGTRAPGFRQEP